MGHLPTGLSALVALLIGAVGAPVEAAEFSYLFALQTAIAESERVSPFQGESEQDAGARPQANFRSDEKAEVDS